MLLVLGSLPLPPLFSCSLKKASRAYKYAPLPPGAKFLPPIPFPLHPPIALRSLHRGGRSLISLYPPSGARFPSEAPPTEDFRRRTAGSLPPLPCRSDRVLPEVTICEFPAFLPVFLPCDSLGLARLLLGGREGICLLGRRPCMREWSECGGRNWIHGSVRFECPVRHSVRISSVMG